MAVANLSDRTWKRVHLLLTESQHDALSTLAALEGQSVNAEIRLAVESRLKDFDLGAEKRAA